MTKFDQNLFQKHFKHKKQSKNSQKQSKNSQNTTQTVLKWYQDLEPIPVGDSPLQFTPLINLIYMPDKKLSVMIQNIYAVNGCLLLVHKEINGKESCAASEANLAKIHGETGQKYMEVAKLL